MTGHDSAAYGRAIGDDYDRLYPDPPDTEDTVALLAALAEAGPVLELGIGTGRLGLPLVERGLTVAGIEGSQTIADQLRAKPRGSEIEVAVGDFAGARVDGAFSLVALVFNTIFALPDREAQQRCFANAARHLRPGGRFVVEAFVLAGDQLDGRWWVRPRNVGDDHVELQLGRYEIATERLERALVHLTPDGTRMVNVRDTYAWPGELDLMAGQAGFVLQERWGGWRRERFSAASEKHVTVYRLSGPDGDAPHRPE
jgi:SAM-dependent methyltransferase